MVNDVKKGSEKMNNEEIENLMKNGIVMVDGEPVVTAKWVLEQFEKQEKKINKVKSLDPIEKMLWINILIMQFANLFVHILQ